MVMLLEKLSSSIARRDLDLHVLKVTHTTINDILTSLQLINPLNIKASQEQKRALVKFHPRNILSKADSRSVSEAHVILVVDLSLIFVQPSLRLELLSVIAVNVGVTVYEPRVAGDFGTLRDKVTADLKATSGCNTRENVGRGGIETHALFDASDIVGAVLDDLVVLGHFGELSSSGGLVNLGKELLVNSWVGEDVNHHGLESSASCISTGQEDK